MSALELFLHDERADLPLLIKAGLVHVQFETIHPFLDGNGRLGRLLITFLLCAAGVLREPILYLSLYFKQHRPAYYDLLDRVRAKGEWETWLDFFLTGVRDTAEQAASRRAAHPRGFRGPPPQDRGVGPSGGIRRCAYSNICSATRSCRSPPLPRSIGISAPTVAKSLEHMQQLGHAARDHRAAAPSAVRLRCLSCDLERGNGTDSVNHEGRTSWRMPPPRETALTGESEAKRS